ncbi:response regulator [Desulfococcus sp.]|uniref:CBS domain-containing protein n=1 Tax=Desulfococcus sp. TaxID=2025834 RepID=UPI003592F77F
MTEQIKVLMVDDEAQFRATTSRILNKKGFATTIAASGEEAIGILTDNPQDVVILDIKMPGMDGHEALGEIKKICPETQVIMLTGHGAEVSAKASREKGAYDYLSKPCDIDLLALKINEAFKASHKDLKKEEKNAGNIMIRLDDYTSIGPEQTVREAVQALMRTFEGLISSSRVMETGHRSLLVCDANREVIGILSILDLIEAARPGYLSAAKPSMADSIQYSRMFWSGLFSTQVKALAGKKVAEVMSDTPPCLDEDTNLMELADFMYSQQVRRVLITRKGRVVGVVREQDLFFEMAHIIF